MYYRWYELVMCTTGWQWDTNLKWYNDHLLPILALFLCDYISLSGGKVRLQIWAFYEYEATWPCDSFSLIKELLKYFKQGEMMQSDRHIEKKNTFHVNRPDFRGASENLERSVRRLLQMLEACMGDSSGAGKKQMDCFCLCLFRMKYREQP